MSFAEWCAHRPWTARHCLIVAPLQHPVRSLFFCSHSIMAYRTLQQSASGAANAAAPGMRGSRCVRRSSLKVAAEQQRGRGPPPAWDRRVVVPEVQPRDTPKVGWHWCSACSSSHSTGAGAIAVCAGPMGQCESTHAAATIQGHRPRLPPAHSDCADAPAAAPPPRLRPAHPAALAPPLLPVPPCVVSLFSAHVQPFSVLGSTGSIGTQTLDIIAEFPDKFRLVALAAGGNVELLAQQVRSGSLLLGGKGGAGACWREEDVPVGTGG